MADLVLTIYGDDDTTEYVAFGTSATHARPYLHMPDSFAESEIDLVEGRARIGRINVRVIDPQTGTTQTERFVTSILGDAEGYSKLNGRRATLAWDDGRIVQDGICAGATLSETYAGFELALEDIRARGVEIGAFDRSGTSSVLPQGVVEDFGLLPSGEYLMTAVAPLVATYNVIGTGGVFDLTAYWEHGTTGGPSEGATVEREVILSLAARRAVRPYTTDEGRRYDAEVWWRAQGATSWNVLKPTGQELVGRMGATYDGQHVQAATDIVVPTDAPGTHPADGSTVEVIVAYTGPASEAYPAHYEGTLGGYAVALMRGDYSRRAPRIRYDEAAWLAVDTPVRIRHTEPVEDLREHLEELCRARGMAPGVNAAGEVVPVVSDLPDPALVLPVLDDDNCAPVPGWEHPITGAVTVVEYTYPRLVRVPDEEDPTGEHSAADRIEAVEQQVRIEPIDSALLDVMGEHVHEVDGWPFAALGGEEGEPLTGDVADENGFAQGYRTGHALIDRLMYGGQSSFVRAMRSDADVAALGVGDWVLDRRSWAPNYASGQRGRDHLAQVMAVRDLNPAWREIRLLDAAPYANPLTVPTLGAPTAAADGTVSIPVDAIPTGAEARVDYAVSATEPAADSGLWTYAGRTDAVGTIQTPALPAGVTVWVRGRSEKEGRRPSLWTAAQSVPTPQTPRIRRVWLETEFGDVVAYWTRNAWADGVRIYYEQHAAGVTPTLASYVDAPGSAGQETLPITPEPGKVVTVEVEPWTTWTGTAVSGTAGARRQAARDVPAADAELVFEYASDSAGSNSSTTFDPNVHTYARHSADGGLTWTAWYKIVGEDGASADGRYTDYRFKAAATQPAAPSSTDDTDAELEALGWFDAPPAYDPATEYLWITRVMRDGADDSLLSTWSTPRQLSGPEGPEGPAGTPWPTAKIEKIGRTATSETLRFSGELHEDGVGPLEWRYGTDTVGTGTVWNAWQTSVLPQTVAITRDARYGTFVHLEVRDAAGNVGRAQVLVDPELKAIGGGGAVDPAVPMESGFFPFQKDLDDLDVVLDGSSYRRAGIAYIDASNRITHGYRSAVTEPFDNLFKRGVNTVADVIDAESTTGAQTKADAAKSDALSSAGSWTSSYTVNTTSGQHLRDQDGNYILSSAGYAYIAEARVTGTSTDTYARVYFIPSNDGLTFTLYKVYQRGTTSNHPEFYVGSRSGASAMGIRLYDHTTLYAVEVKLTRVRGTEIASRLPESVVESASGLKESTTWRRAGVAEPSINWFKRDTDTLDRVLDSPSYQRTTPDEKTGAGRAYRSFDDDALLKSNVTASDGVSPKLLPKGAKSGVARNGQPIVFADTYNSPPLVIFAGGATMQEQSKWGSQAEADQNDGQGAGLESKPSTAFVAQQVGADVSATGFTARLRLVAKGTPTLKSANFGAPTTVSSLGGTTGTANPADLDTPSMDDKYTAAFRVSGSSLSGGEEVHVEVAMDVSIGGGAWTEVGTKWVIVYIPSGGTVAVDASLTALVSGIDGGNDSFRLRVKSVIASGSAVFNDLTLPADPDLTWYHDSGAKYASMTPNGDADAVPFFVIAEG